MKKILTIGFILISLISYSKPIPVYVLRYKGQVLDVRTIIDRFGYIEFKFNKKEMSDSDLINCLSTTGFNIYGNEITYYYASDIGRQLPKNITLTKEIYNFK